MGFPAKDFDEGSAVVKAGIQEKQITLFETLDELADEFMFRGADLAVDET